MSTAHSLNAFAPAAAQLQTTHYQTEQERLYREALDNVKSRKSWVTQDENVIARFQIAQTPDDFLSIFEDCREGNDLLQSQTASSKTHRVAQSASRFLAISKEFGDKVTIANQTIAAPTWGVLCAVLKIIESSLKVGEQLNTITSRIKHCMSLYNKLARRNAQQDEDIRRSLLQFNETVIEFSISIGSALSKSRRRTWRTLIDKTLQEELDRLTQDLKEATTKVHEAVNFNTNDQITVLTQSRAFPPIPTISTPVIEKRLCRYRVPEMLSPYFTGRRKETSTLQTQLGDTSQFGCQKCVLVGIGGVGKTQLALHYIDRATLQQYEHVLYVRAGSRDVLQNDFAQLAEELGLCDSFLAESAPSRVADKMKIWLRKTDKWLLVFDNVADSNDVAQLLPNSSNGHIIFTTRNRIAANNLARPENIIQVDPLHEETEALELVLRLASVSHSSFAQNAAALAIAAFSKGLPLAIEQIVNLGVNLGMGWENVLPLVSKKFSLLKQQNFCSTHERGLSVGAIVATSIDGLKMRDPKAAALFKLLVYFSPSSIPISLLHGAKNNLQNYFDRQHTFYKGQLRSQLALRRKSQFEYEQSRRFSLWDYDPFEADLYKKLFQMTFKRSHAPSSLLPRVDSDSDVQLYTFWMSQISSLQAALESDLVTDSALVSLESFGLIKRLNNRNVIWIHDLFADLARAVIELDSPVVHQNFAHSAATMVFLASPLPVHPHARRCAAFLPHAISAHRHLRSVNMLNSSTVGPELSVHIANAISSVEVAIVRPMAEMHMRNDQVMDYVRCAVQGYLSAWKRLREARNVTDHLITLSTYADYALEEYVGGYHIHRHLLRSERFGKSAPWRCIQSMAKLGDLLSGQNQHDQAESLLEKTVKMAQTFFGFGSHETQSYLDKLQHLKICRGDWQQAYHIARKRVEYTVGCEVSRVADPLCLPYLDLHKQTLSYLRLEQYDAKPHASQKAEDDSKDVLKMDRVGMKMKTALSFRRKSTLSSVMSDDARAFVSDTEGKVVSSRQDLLVILNSLPAFDDISKITSNMRGREVESLFWHSVVLRSCVAYYGENSPETIRPMQHMSEAYLRFAEVINVDRYEGARAKQIYNFRAALHLILNATEVALQRGRARTEADKRFPTMAERIKAGEILWDGVAPEDEEEREQINEFHRRQMKDHLSEDLIKTLRIVESKMPAEVYDFIIGDYLKSVNKEIERWEEEQAYWQGKSYMPALQNGDGESLKRHQMYDNIAEDMSRWRKHAATLVST